MEYCTIEQTGKETVQKQDIIILHPNLELLVYSSVRTPNTPTELDILVIFTDVNTSILMLTETLVLT